MTFHLILNASLALTTAIIAGLLFVFSNFALRAFESLGPRTAVGAMQAINRTILNPLFFVLFIGTTIGTLGLGIHTAINWSGAAGAWSLGGTLLYVIGVLGVTARVNVPLNEQLDEHTPTDDAATAAVWTRYRARWVPWNHLRVVASTAAAGCFLAAALALSG